MPHARICAGGSSQELSLPRPLEVNKAEAKSPIRTLERIHDTLELLRSRLQSTRLGPIEDFTAMFAELSKELAELHPSANRSAGNT